MWHTCKFQNQALAVIKIETKRITTTNKQKGDIMFRNKFLTLALITINLLTSHCYLQTAD
jgi:hypothetical protein